MRERIWAPLPLLLPWLLLPPPLWCGPQDSQHPEREPEPGPLQPFDLLYASGVAAYYSGDYELAVRDLEAALRSHRRLREIRARCARHCAARRPLAPPGAGPGAELPFFRALLERARCYRSCQSQRLGGPASRHRASEDVRSDFQRRVPYNYLQRAYIKVPRAHTSRPPAPPRCLEPSRGSRLPGRRVRLGLLERFCLCVNLDIWWPELSSVTKTR